MSVQWPTFAPHRKKVLVFGSRSFQDKDLLFRKMDKLTYNFPDVVVVSGNAAGADCLGEYWAFFNRFTVVRFHPDWDKYGKIAGFYRNLEMAQYVNADGCAVGFWDGYSKGTAHMIGLCRLYDVPLRIVRFE